MEPKESPLPPTSPESCAQEDAAAEQKIPSSRSRFNEAKRQRKLQESSSSRSRRRFLNSRKQKSLKEQASSLPGDLRIAQPGSAEYSVTHLSTAPQLANGDNYGNSNEQNMILEARIVSLEEDENENVPYAEDAVPIKPWKHRLGILLLILLVTGITIGIVVPITTKRNNNGSAAGTKPTFPTVAPSTSPVPSLMPTTTMAPTSYELTSVVIQLDSKPQETGWKLDCKGLNIANVPAGVYQGLANRLVTAQLSIQVGLACTFTISDTGRDGMDAGSFYRVHYGASYSHPGNSLIRGNGTFANEQVVDFIMEAPVTESPTRSPTVMPTTSSPTASPTACVDCGSAAPTMGIPRPTLKPASPHPIPALLYGEIMLDAVPSETGFRLVCNGSVLAEAAPRTFANAGELYTFTVSTIVGALCVFTITDEFGDGICCALDPPGFYRLYHGSEADPDKLLAQGGEFAFEEIVNFIVG